MSLFKNIQEENNLMKRTILPETMTMSYSEFVAQEHDRKVDPIKNELAALETHISTLRSLYQEALQRNSPENAMLVSESLKLLVNKQKEKRLELSGAEREYSIDISAKSLADMLDHYTVRKRLYDLYMQIRYKSIELVKLAATATELASYCGTEAMAAGNICWSFQKQILPNMKHDLDYHIYITDREALLDALETRLQELKVESDKKVALENKIKGLEGV